MPRPSTIDLEIPRPAPDQKLPYILLLPAKVQQIRYFCFYKCKNKCSWCSTWRCACLKADVKCGATCHGETDRENDNMNAPTLISLIYVYEEVCALEIEIMRVNQVNGKEGEHWEKLESKSD